jgi:hypothetical protein
VLFSKIFSKPRDKPFLITVPKPSKSGTHSLAGAYVIPSDVASKPLAKICGFDGPIMMTIVENPESAYDGPIMMTIVENPESAYVKGGLHRKIGVELPKPGFQKFHGHKGKVGGAAGGVDGALISTKH